jgi:ABC-type branched-subunit amino acid transport system ATPase component
MSIDLVAEHVTVRFGGLLAVDDFSVRAAAGEITGLIGPNGAGKTTTFNALTGMVPTTGTVRLGDRLLDGMNTAKRARAGLGRSFQRMELFDTMTVTENVFIGPELLYAGAHSWRHVFASRAERADCRELAAAAMDRCQIGAIANRFAGDLSTGQRRLVELARAIACPFDFLLLDEPSSGLDVGETEHFAAVLRSVIADRGIGILLVEHDMALVRAVCSYIYVLDFGKQLIDGSAADVLSSDVVRAAYLGSEAVDDAVEARA